jgi:hypothetical protein
VAEKAWMGVFVCKERKKKDGRLCRFERKLSSRMDAMMAG